MPLIIKSQNLFTLLIISTIFVAACNGQPPKSDDTNIGTITLKVGDSATCYTSGSCAVYLVMPDSGGEYTIKQDGPAGIWTAGTFPANGQTVLLGEFYSGRTEFTFEGLDVPKTWVSVNGDF
jgi:hypothetical protein